MGKTGNINLRQRARVQNILKPVDAREPTLSINVAPKIITNRLLSNQVKPAALTTLSTSANIARVSIIEIPCSITINAIITDISTVTAASGYRNALYILNNNSYLSNLIADGGSDKGNTVIGLNTDVVSNILLMPGVYGLVTKCSNAVTLRAINSGNATTFLGHTNTAGFTIRNGFTVPFNWVANTPFPAVFPTLTPTYNYSNQILYCLRAV